MTAEKKFVFALVLFAACASFAQGLRVRVDAYLAQSGVDPDAARLKSWVVYGTDARIETWRVPAVPWPAEADLPSAEDAPAILAAYAVSAEAARQAAKPAARKAYENEFFAFVRLVLAAAGDPRADDVPTPKLGFEELTPMIEGIQASDPMAAVNLTLKGLSIDSALKRYDAMWWDDAVEHEAQ